jgi:hypothetical protein
MRFISCPCWAHEECASVEDDFNGFRKKKERATLGILTNNSDISDRVCVDNVKRYTKFLKLLLEHA